MSSFPRLCSAGVPAGILVGIEQFLKKQTILRTPIKFPPAREQRLPKFQTVRTVPQQSGMRIFL